MPVSSSHASLQGRNITTQVDDSGGQKSLASIHSLTQGRNFICASGVLLEYFIKILILPLPLSIWIRNVSFPVTSVLKQSLIKFGASVCRRPTCGGHKAEGSFYGRPHSAHF